MQGDWLALRKLQPTVFMFWDLHLGQWQIVQRDAVFGSGANQSKEARLKLASGVSFL